MAPTIRNRINNPFHNHRTFFILDELLSPIYQFPSPALGTGPIGNPPDAPGCDGTYGCGVCAVGNTPVLVCPEGLTSLLSREEGGVIGWVGTTGCGMTGVVGGTGVAAVGEGTAGGDGVPDGNVLVTVAGFASVLK